MNETTATRGLGAAGRDFARIMRIVIQSLRYASFLMVGVTVVVVTREVASAFTWLSDVHPVLGWAFLVLFAAALCWFVGRPVMRFWRVPPAVKQPRLPVRAQADLRSVVRRLDFVLRYVSGLLRNPRVQDRRERVEKALENGAELRNEIVEGVHGDAAAALAALTSFEGTYVEPLLRPLDEEANKAIRQEAMIVGVGTAVSMNGTIDAFVVLWRNANLVARVATIYYGRPGPRGCLFIIRDVATAMFIATQMQGVMETVGGLFGGWLGKAGSVLAGPAADGALNALATVRIGYVAKARCRSYRPWNEATIPDIMRGTMKEVASQGKGVVRDVLGTIIKGGLVKLPAEMARRTGDFLAGLFGREKPSPQTPG